jgi:hypothetical protein
MQAIGRFHLATTADRLYDIYAVCANPEGYEVHGAGPLTAHTGYGGGDDHGWSGILNNTSIADAEFSHSVMCK